MLEKYFHWSKCLQKALLEWKVLCSKPTKSPHLWMSLKHLCSLCMLKLKIELITLFQDFATGKNAKMCTLVCLVWIPLSVELNHCTKNLLENYQPNWQKSLKLSLLIELKVIIYLKHVQGEEFIKLIWTQQVLACKSSGNIRW